MDTAVATEAPPFPLSSEGNDWFALDGSWTRHQAASEIAHNLMDWWLDDFVSYDDDDNPIGWATGYRQLLTALKRGYLRPYESGDAWQSEGEPGWWFECNADHPQAVEAWLWKQ